MPATNNQIRLVCAVIADHGGRVDTVVDAPVLPGEGPRIKMGLRQFEVLDGAAVRCDDCLETIGAVNVVEHVCKEWWK